MCKAFAGCFTVLAACSAAAPSYAQQYDDNSACCELIAAGDWNLADLRATGSFGGLTGLAAENLSATAPQGGQDNLSGESGPPPAAMGPTIGNDGPRRWADHVPEELATHRGFWKQTGTIKTEMLLFFGYFSLQSGKKLFREHTEFHFNNEGWFGKNTTNLGIDKLTHAFDTYLIAEILHMRLHEKTNASAGDAVTAAVLASGLMALNELSDGIETDSGYSMQDIVMNLAGASFSVLRNTVPGLKEKVAFKIEIMPNGSVYSYRGQRHYEQQRYMFSVKGAGFEELRKTPLRFVDLQIGYYGSRFFQKDREAGFEPKRHLFVGLGLNIGELLFGGSGSKVGKAAYTVLDYFQLPYTSLRYDTTGRFGH